MVTFYLSALLSRNFWNFYIFCICRFWFLLLSCCRCCLTHFFSIFHFFWLFLRYLSVILCTHKSNNKSKTELKIRLKLRFAFFFVFYFLQSCTGASTVLPHFMIVKFSEDLGSSILFWKANLHIDILWKKGGIQWTRIRKRVI